MMQVDLDIAVVVDGCLHRGRKGHRAMLSSGLGPIEGDVCVSQKFPGLRPVALGNANTCGYLQGSIACCDQKRGSQDVADSLCHHLRPSGERDSLDKYDELVAPEPTHRVPFTESTGKSGGHTGEQLITCLMPQGVIDVLEVIEVEKQCCQWGVLASGARQHLFGSVEDQRAVGKPGESIMEGRVGQLILGVLATSDVTEVGDKAVHVGICCQIGDGGLEPQPVTVGAPETDLLVDGGTGNAGGGHGSAEPCPVIGVDQGLAKNAYVVGAWISEN